MDISGFLTLIAVILTGFSLLSRGQKVTYVHRFGVIHLIAFVLGFGTVLSCLFYDTLSAHNLLLPYKFITGFDENDLLLLASLSMFVLFVISTLYGFTPEHRLASLCNSVDKLLTSNALGDLVYVLSENIAYFEDDSSRSERDKSILSTTMIRLLLSQRFIDYISEMDYQLYLRLLKLDCHSEVSARKYNEFLRKQLSDRRSSLLWEARLLREAYSPRVPNNHTPLLKSLYHEQDTKLRYSFYQQIGYCSKEYLLENRVLDALKTAPDNVITDDVINNSLIGLHIFLVFNLLKSDLKRGTIVRHGHDVRAPYIVLKNILFPLVEAKIVSSSKIEQEFESRIDFFIYEVIKSFDGLLKLAASSKITNDELLDLTECVASAHFFVRQSRKFTDDFLQYMLIDSIDVYSALKEGNPEIATTFATLCTRRHQFEKRLIDLSTTDFEVMTRKDSEDFIRDSLK
ncbi:TPA: hypothetical protein NK433_003502 [Vibrio parahaemolyticus]|nr:hypothetical protein [Vibrio parahaemolyticus]